MSVGAIPCLIYALQSLIATLSSYLFWLDRENPNLLDSPSVWIYMIELERLNTV